MAILVLDPLHEAEVRKLWPDSTRRAGRKSGRG